MAIGPVSQVSSSGIGPTGLSPVNKEALKNLNNKIKELLEDDKFTEARALIEQPANRSLLSQAGILNEMIEWVDNKELLDKINKIFELAKKIFKQEGREAARRALEANLNPQIIKKANLKIETTLDTLEADIILDEGLEIFEKKGRDETKWFFETRLSKLKKIGKSVQEALDFTADRMAANEKLNESLRIAQQKGADEARRYLEANSEILKKAQINLSRTLKLIREQNRRQDALSQIQSYARMGLAEQAMNILRNNQESLSEAGSDLTPVLIELFPVRTGLREEKLRDEDVKFFGPDNQILTWRDATQQNNLKEIATALRQTLDSNNSFYFRFDPETPGAENNRIALFEAVKRFYFEHKTEIDDLAAETPRDTKTRNFTFGSETISKANFREIGDPDVIWDDLLKGGYINGDGIIQDKFKSCRSPEELTVEHYFGQRDKIYEALKNSQNGVVRFNKAFFEVLNKYRNTRPVNFQPVSGKEIATNKITASLQFARNNPFAALKIKLSLDRGLGIPVTVTDDLSKNDLEFLADVLSGGAAYFHGHLSNPEIEELRKIQDKYNSLSQESRLISKLLLLSSSDLVTLTTPEEKSTLKVLAEKHDLIANLRDTYFADAGVEPYFHRPINAEERQQLIKIRDDKFNQGSPSYKIINKLLRISFSGRIFLDDPAELKELDTLAEKEKGLISELRKSYYADSQANPKDAQKIRELIELIWGQKTLSTEESAAKAALTEGDPHNPTITAQKIGGYFENFPNLNYQNLKEYEKGLYVVIREALAARINFDPKNPREYTGNVVWRLVKNTAIDAWTLLSEGARPAPVAMGINNIENWRLLVLKRMYLMETKKWRDFVEFQNNHKKEMETIVNQIDQIRRDSRSTEDQKIAELTKLIERFFYIRGLLENQYQQLFLVDQEFFDWFVKRFAILPSNQGFWGWFDQWRDRNLRQPFNEAELQSTVINPFTGKVIHLNDVHNILRGANSDPDVRNELALGWMSLDPAKGSEASALVKMALALSITYLRLDKESVGASFVPVDPTYEHLKMGINMMFNQEPPLSHIGAQIKSDLMLLSGQLYKEAPLIRTEFFNNFNQPDEINVFTIKVLKRIIKDLSLQGASDPEIDRLNEVIKRLGGTVSKDVLKNELKLKAEQNIPSEVSDLFEETRSGDLIPQISKSELDGILENLVKRQVITENQKEDLKKLILEALNAKKFEMTSDNFGDLNAQELMQAYYYLGKIFTGITKQRDVSSQEGESPDSIIHRGLNLVTNGMWTEIWDHGVGRAWEAIPGSDRLGQAKKEFEAQGIKEDSFGTTVGRYYGIRNPTALSVTGGTIDAVTQTVPDAAREFSYTLARFGPYVGAQFGAVLPYNIGRNLVYATGINQLFGGQEKTVLAIDEKGRPVEDSEGRLVFEKIGLDDVAKSVLTLVGQVCLFYNDPFLLYGWLKIPDDIHNGNWRLALVKLWCANFYLLAPGKDGFWSSTWGRFLTIDRFLWRMYAAAQKIKIWAKENGQLEQLERETEGTPLGKALRCKTWKDYRNEYAAKRGWLGAMYEFGQDRDSAGSWLRKIMARTIVGAGKVGGGSEWLISPLSKMHEFVSNHANENSWAYGTKKVFDELLRIPQQTLNLTYWEGRVYRRATSSANAVGTGRFMQQENDFLNPARNQRVIEIDNSDFTEADTRVPGGPEPVLARSVPPDREMALPGAGRSSARSRPGEGEVLGLSDEDLIRIFATERGQPRQVTFALKTGPRSVETMKLPVRRIVIDSIIATNSPDPVTIVPCKPGGIPFEAASDYASAEVHINSQRLNFQGANAIEIERQGGQQQKEISESEKNILLQLFGQELDFAVQKAELIPAENPAFFREAPLLTVSEFERLINENGFSITDINEIFRNGQVPLTREMALDLVRLLNESSGSLMLTDRNSRKMVSKDKLIELIRQVTSEIYTPQEADPRQSDHYVFELCGNDAIGNSRPALLNETDYSRLPEAAGRRRVKLSDVVAVGKSRVITHLRQIEGAPNPALEAQVIGRAETYLEGQIFAREVAEAQKEFSSEHDWSDARLQQESSRLLKLCDGSGPRQPTNAELIRAGAVYCEAVRRVTLKENTEALTEKYLKEDMSRTEAVTRARAEAKPVILTPSQIMAGYFGNLATAEVPVFIDLGTGEGKTWAIGLDQYLSLTRGFRVGIVTAQCDAYAKQNFNEIAPVFEFLSVPTDFIEKTEKSPVRRRDAFRNGGSKRVIFCGFDMPRFSFLESIFPNFQGRPVFVPNTFYLKVSNDESDHGLWDMRRNPAIISSGGSAQAADQELVLLAEECVRGLYENGVLQERFIESSGSRENIGISVEGVKKVESVLQGKKLGGQRISGKIPETLLPYIRTALHVHKFMQRGTDYLERGGYIFTRRYVFRDKATGRKDFDLQFDLAMHKAVQAKIGCQKITDPGVSPVAVTVPEFFQYVVHSNYSGTEGPLAVARAREGGLAVAVESAFARTRIDHPGIVFKTKAEQLKAVVGQAITDAGRGASLVHAAVAEQAEQGVLSIDEIFDSIKTEFSSQGRENIPIYSLENLEQVAGLIEEVEKQEEAASQDPSRDPRLLQNAKDNLNSFLAKLKKKENPKKREMALISRKTGELPFIVMRLTDEISIAHQEKVARLIGSNRAITITDIANRALNPGLKTAISQATGSTHVVIRSVVTQWKESIRHFLQEIARIGRPDPKRGFRAPGEDRGMYSLEDPNFAPAIRAYLDFEILQNGGNPVVILPPDYPDSIELDSLRKTALEEIKYLEEKKAISPSEANKAREEVGRATGPAEIKKVMRGLGGQITAIVQRFWQVSEEQLIEENMRNDGSRGKADQKFNETLHKLNQLLENPAPTPGQIKEVFGQAIKDAVKLLMKEMGISDAVNRQNWDIKKFCDEVSKRFGIELRIENPDNFQTAGELFEKISEGIDQQLARASLSGYTKTRLVEILKERIAELQFTLEAGRREAQFFPNRILLENGLNEFLLARLSTVLAEGIQPNIFYNRVVQDPTTGLPVTTGGRVRVGALLRLRGFCTGRALELGSIRLVSERAPDPIREKDAYIKFIEKQQLEHKLRALVEERAAGFTQDANALTIEIVTGTNADGSPKKERFDLVSVEGVTKLNRALENLGSRKRIYFDAREWRFIFGTARVEEVPQVSGVPAERRIIFESEEVISPSIRERSLAFIPRQPTTLFGDELRLETVIRGKAQEEFYEQMADLAFNEGSRDVPGAQLARAVFVTVGIRNKEEAESKKTEKQQVLDNFVEVVKAHESGHAAVFAKQGFEAVNASRILSPLADVLFETIADLNILRSIGSESTPAKIRLLAHLYYLNSFRADAKGRVSAAMTSVLEQCIGENGQVDFQKLADIEGRLSQFLENQLVEIEQQLAKIRDNQGRIDFLRQKERQIIKGIQAPSTLPAPASPSLVFQKAPSPPPPPPPPPRRSAVDQIETEKVKFRGVEVDKNNGTLILVHQKGRVVEILEIPQAQQTELDNLRTSLSGLTHELPFLFEYNPNHGGSKVLEKIVRPNEAHLLRVDTRQKAERAFEIIEQCQKQSTTATAGASQLADLGIIINPDAIIQVEAVVSPDYCAVTSNFVGAHPNSIQAHFEPQSSVTSKTDQARKGLVLRLQPDDNLEICLVGSFSDARASAGGFRQPSVQEIVEATPEAFAGRPPLPSESAGRVVVIIPAKSETTEDLCAVLESIEKSAEGSQIYFESTEKISVNVSAGQAEIIKTYFNNYQSYTQQILNAPEEVGRILGLADLDAGFQQFLENRILTEIHLTLAGESVKFSRQAGNIVLEFGRGQRQTFTIEEQALVSVFRFEKIADQIVEATLRAHPDYNPSLVRARVLASLQRLANKGAGQHQIPLTIISGRRENILFKEVGIEKSGKQFRVRVSNKVLAKLQTTDPSQDVYLQVVEELKREVQDEIRKARKQNSEYQNVSVNDFIKPLTYQTIAVQGKTITLSHRALASLTRCSSDSTQYREAMQELENQLRRAGVADLAGARAEVLRGLFMVGYAEKFQETFGQLTERLGNNFYEEELRKIDLSKPDLNIQQELQQARERASKRMAQVIQTLSAETVLQELALRADSRWVDSKNIDEFLRNKYEEIARRYNINLPYRPPQSRNTSGATDVRETLGTWKWLCIGAPKWLCIGAPGGGLGHKTAFVGKETARGVGEGLIATAIFVGAKNIWMHGLPWNWTGDAWLKAKEEIEVGTVGWAKFSARAGVGKAFFGLTGHQPTAFAFFLDTQRSIHDARPEEKFLAATTGVINFGSFVGGQQLTGRLIQVLPLPPWMKGTLATIGGMVGAEVSNLVVDSIVSRNPELGELFASPEFVTAGKVLDMAGSTYATKLYTQFSLKAASFVLRDLGAEAAAGTVGKLAGPIGWVIAGLDLVSWQVNDLVDSGATDFRIKEREDLYENWSKPFRYQKSKVLYYNDWFWSQMPIFGRWASKIKVGNENEFFSAIKSTYFLSHGLLGLSMLGYIDRNSVIGPDGDKEVFRKIFDQARKNAEKNRVWIPENQRILQKVFFKSVFNFIEDVKSHKITVEDFDTKLKDLVIQQAAENPDFDPRVAVIIAKTIKEKAEKEINQKFDQRDQQIGQPEQRLKFEIEQKFPDLFREYLSKIISKNYSDKLNEIRGAFLSNLPSRYSALPLQEQKALKEFYRAQGIEVENIKDPIEFLKKVLIFKIKTTPGGNQRLDAEINLLVEHQVNQILAGFTFDRITQGMKEPERQKLEAEFRQFLKENHFVRLGQTANLSQESPSFLHSANITTNATLTTYTVPQDLTALLPLPTGKDLFEKFSEFMLARQGISLVLDEKEIESTYGNIRDFNQIPSPDVLKMSSPHRLPFLNETPNLVEGFKKYLESRFGDIYETQEEAKKRGYLRFNNEMGQIISEYSREFSRGRLTALFLHCLEKGEAAFRKGEYDVALGYYSKIKDLEIASALKQRQINERYAFCLNKLKENPATRRSVAASLHIDTSPTEADIDKALIEICQRLAFLFEIKEQYEKAGNSQEADKIPAEIGILNSILKGPSDVYSDLSGKIKEEIERAKNSPEIGKISVEIESQTNSFFLNMPDMSSLLRRGQVLDTSPSIQSKADTQVTKVIEKKDGDTATLSLTPPSQQQSRRVRSGEFSSLRTDIPLPIGLGVSALPPGLFRREPIQPNSPIQPQSPRFSLNEDIGGTKSLDLSQLPRIKP